MLNTSNHPLRWAVLLCLVAVVCTSIAVAQAPAVSPTIDPINGYPLWYQDASVPGIRLQGCLNDQDPNCVLLADPGFNPANPVVFPTNFPVEFFYFVADSDKLTTPGCPASGIAAGTAKWRGAVEGSFLTGVVAPGQQSTFTRTKIVASGLCPNTSYTFTTPYGADLVTTNAAGQIVANKKGATIDIGCLAAPCDFTAALPSRVLGGYLQFDPAVNVPPAGYLGDAVTLSPIIGSPTGTNLFSITNAGGTVLASTSLFTVSGKIAGPLMASPSVINFGGVVQSTLSLPQSITITNVYSTSITVTGASFTGANALDFAVSSNGCTAPLARDASCTLAVTFQPSLLAPENATLAVAHDGPFGSPLNVSLTGTGIAPGTAPVVSLDKASLSYGSQRVRTISAAQTVTVTNTGTAPLAATATIINVPPDSVTGLPLAGADQFTILNDTCSGNFVPVGGTCAVGVQFAPTVAAASTALLNFADNALTSPQTVTLTGTGTGGIAAVSATSFLDANGVDTGFPNWYQDENGVQVQPCLDPTDPGCVLIPDPGFNGLPPVLYVSNFPVEFFYFVADSDKMDTPGCPSAGTTSTKVTYRAAMEGSFALGVAQVGQDTMFTRTKIVVPPGGLCPNTTYAFVTPYGTDLITTDAGGGIVANKKGATVDIGCFGSCTGANTALPLSSRVFGGFLKWDPAVAPAAPAGHLGDAGFVGGIGVGTPHAVIGSPYTPPGETAPANFFRIADATTGATLSGCKNAAGVTGPCQVNLFTVSGKLAVPVQTSQVFAPGPVTFLPTILGATSLAQTVTLKNADPLNSVLIGAAAVLTTPGGAASPDFSMVAGADHCSGVSLGAGLTCTIDVVFQPTAGGLLAGVLVVPHGGLNSPAEVPLSGIGVAVNATTTSITAPAVIFPANGLVTVTVSALVGIPAGDVSLIVDGGAAVALPLDATGSAIFTVTSPAVGSHTLSASYAGSATFGASSASGTLTVNSAATTTGISAPTVTFPAGGVVTVTVSSTAGTPGGSVSLSVDGGAATTQALVSGSATFTLTGLSAAVHSLSASYAGNATFAASSATGTLMVNPATTTTAISAPAVTFPANAFATVTVTAPAVTVTGCVTLSVDGGLPGACTPLAGGATTFTLFSPSVGTHTLVASYAAQGNFTASSSVAVLTVNPGAVNEVITATASASRNKQLTAASWTINGTTSILASHTMTVTLTRTGVVIGTATTDIKGRWKLSNGKSPVVPITGDTITVTSSLGKTQSFPVTVK